MSKHEKFTPRDSSAVEVPAWIRVAHISRYYSTGKTSVYRAEKAGKIKVYRESGSRVKREDVEKWLSGEA